MKKFDTNHYLNARNPTCIKQKTVACLLLRVRAAAAGVEYC